MVQRMKTLTKYLNEKLVIFPSQVDEKSGIFQSQVDEKSCIFPSQVDEKSGIFPSQVDEKSGIFPSQVDEKLVINKDYNDPYTCVPTSWKELRKIIEDRYKKFGPGTKDTPVDFNNVDVSNIDSFCYKDNTGIFERTKFEYIDISDWNVSNIKDMSFIFIRCKQLKSVGDISGWNVSNVKDMSYMFDKCKNLKSIGDLSNWNVSNVRYMNFMFNDCEQLKSVGDLSKWDVSNVKFMTNVFDNSRITNIPKWYRV